jgi:hypothetical protein
MAKPIGILFEHPEWFKPLFATLDRLELPYERIAAHEHRFDPSSSESPYGLVVNRVSASSYLRDHVQAIHHARQYLDHLEQIGVPVVNGLRAFELDLSKARQITLLSRLGLPHPRSRVANTVGQVEAAATELVYPLIVKPNLGGSGALMRRFDSHDELRASVADGMMAPILGIDATAIVQEFHPARGGSIVRVEALENQLLYGIRIFNGASQNFNLCPADICQAGDQSVADASTPEDDSDLDFCPVDAPALRQLQIEAIDPPQRVVDGVLALFRAGGVDVGGVEYLESERDGQIYLYDVNSLSNFVTDAPKLVGFDPFERLAGLIARRAGLLAAGVR